MLLYWRMIAFFSKKRGQTHDFAKRHQKSPDYISVIEASLFLKEGGYLLSRIALQYHRRKWA